MCRCTNRLKHAVACSAAPREPGPGRLQASGELLFLFFNETLDLHIPLQHRFHDMVALRVIVLGFSSLQTPSVLELAHAGRLWRGFRIRASPVYLAHEPAPYGRSDLRSRLVLAQGQVRLVVSDPDNRRDIGGIPAEPGVAPVAL